MLILTVTLHNHAGREESVVRKAAVFFHQTQGALAILDITSQTVQQMKMITSFILQQKSSYMINFKHIRKVHLT
jgi:hypothetical protein